MERLDTKTYRLSTGREIRADQGIIGIAPRDRALYSGCDGMLRSSSASADPEDDDGDGPMTAGERREIAEFMIEQWRAWGQ